MQMKNLFHAAVLAGAATLGMAGTAHAGGSHYPKPTPPPPTTPTPPPAPTPAPANANAGANANSGANSNAGANANSGATSGSQSGAAATASPTTTVTSNPTATGTGTANVNANPTATGVAGNVAGGSARQGQKQGQQQGQGQQQSSTSQATGGKSTSVASGGKGGAASANGNGAGNSTNVDSSNHSQFITFIPPGHMVPPGTIAECQYTLTNGGSFSLLAGLGASASLDIQKHGHDKDCDFWNIIGREIDYAYNANGGKGDPIQINAAWRHVETKFPKLADAAKLAVKDELDYVARNKTHKRPTEWTQLRGGPIWDDEPQAVIVAPAPQTVIDIHPVLQNGAVAGITAQAADKPAGGASKAFAGKGKGGGKPPAKKPECPTAQQQIDSGAIKCVDNKPVVSAPKP